MTQGYLGSYCLNFKAHDPISLKIYSIPEMNVRLNDIGHGLDPIWILPVVVIQYCMKDFYFIQLVIKRKPPTLH